MDGYRTHRWIAAAGLVVGALAFSIGDVVRRLVEPDTPTAQTIVDAVDRHPSAWSLAGVLSAAPAFLVVPGALALVLLVRGRGARVVTIGACLVAAGAVAALGHAGGYFGMYGAYASADVDPTAVAAMETASERVPVFGVGVVLFMVGMMLGTIVLTVGLRRARLVPVWVPVAAVVYVGAGGSGGLVPGLLGVVAALVTFVPVARVVAGLPSRGPAVSPWSAAGSQNGDTTAISVSDGQAETTSSAIR